MKKIIAAALIAVMALSGCADNKNLPNNGSGKSMVETYGLFNRDSTELECVNYELAWGNIVWSVILVETIVVPIYMMGFSIYEPVSVDENCLKNQLTQS